MRKLVCKTILFCTFTLGACDNDGDVVDFLCGDAVIVDRALYDVTTSSNYIIENITVSGFELTIEISSAGCDGSTWKVCLIDSGVVALSSPPIRSARLSLTNDEDCLAQIQQSYTFDLRPILTNETETVILTLEGWNDQIVINE